MHVSCQKNKLSLKVIIINQQLHIFSNIKINVYLFIHQDPTVSTWTESIKVSASGRDQVDSNGALVNFRTWLSSGISFPGHDHAMLFTG